MTSDPSNYHREHSPYGSYSLFQFEISDVISVLKNSIEYSFVFFKCLSSKALKNLLQHLKLSNSTEKMPILNNESNLKTSIFYKICQKIFNFFLTIRKIMTCPTSVSIC